MTEAADTFIKALDDETMAWMGANAYGTEGSPVNRLRGAQALWKAIRDALKRPVPGS